MGKYDYKILVSSSAANSNGSQILYNSILEKDENPSFGESDPIWSGIDQKTRRLVFRASKDIAFQVQAELVKLKMPYKITLIK